jgi:hypothetical protein
MDNLQRKPGRWNSGDLRWGRLIAAATDVMTNNMQGSSIRWLPRHRWGRRSWGGGGGEDILGAENHMHATRRASLSSDGIAAGTRAGRDDETFRGWPQSACHRTWRAAPTPDPPSRIIAAARHSKSSADPPGFGQDLWRWVCRSLKKKKNMMNAGNGVTRVASWTVRGCVHRPASARSSLSPHGKSGRRETLADLADWRGWPLRKMAHCPPP